MDASTRSTEGLPFRCTVCGKRMSVSPSIPPGDATCPHCGSLIWIECVNSEASDDLRRLAELGAEAEIDDEGEVYRIRFAGARYDDQCIPRLAELTDVAVIDVRDTRISEKGIQKLRQLLPDTIIESRSGK